ncbi:MAG: hypothetical protein ABR499_09085 [Gemmatimonadaceae bacterium]
MRRARRVSALLASFLFAHLLWAGSGFACVMPDMSGMRQSPNVAMAGMNAPGDMSGMDMAGMEMPDTAPPQSDGQHHHAPCDPSPAPDDCQTMTPCAPLALASAEELVRAPGGVPSSVTPLTVLTPPSRVSPPESPPPRA